MKNYNGDGRLKVRLVLDAENREWIIGKFANRLRDNLGDCGVDADIAEDPSPDVDINHWMIYGHPWSYFYQQSRKKLTPSTVMITHIDDLVKVRMVKEVLRDVADLGVCMSRMTLEDLAGRGIDRRQLCYISPGHDGGLPARRIVIAITSRVYPDGRKREYLLVRLAKAMLLELFHFELIGRGWDGVIPSLEEAGATVRYYPGTDDYQKDYSVTMERLLTADYYLYMGLDEGSMGILDALAMGLETIVTTQGFHLDIKDGISHGFSDGDQLIAIFQEIAAKRNRRIQAVESLTWNAYAQRHAVVWRALVQGQIEEIPTLLRPEADAYHPARQAWTAHLLAETSMYSNSLRSGLIPLFVRRKKWEVRHVLSPWKQRILRLVGLR